MEIPTTAYPAVASVVAALIAGGIAFLSLVLSKEQKTSEFRQSWIDALRSDISEFVGFVEVFASMAALKYNKAREDEAFKYVESISSDIKNIAGVYYRIRLRLNPEEHQRLLELIENAFFLFSGEKGSVLDHKGVEALVSNISAEAQTVLKREWKRVKTGEMPFRATRYISIGLFSVAIAVAILYLFDRISISWVT